MKETKSLAAPSTENNYAHLPGLVFGLFIIIILGYIWKDSYMDDAYIGFRCIDNFIKGEGFSFNPLERVESVTNIGWLMLLTPFSVVVRPHIAGKILGAIFLVLSAVIVSRISLRYDRESSEGRDDLHMRHILPILVFTSPTFLYFSHSGMETAFLCTILGLPLFLSSSKHATMYTAIVYGFAFSVRPECLLLFPLYIAALFLVNNRGIIENKVNNKQIFSAIVAWSAILVVISFVRFAYFGDLLPNTFYSKQSTLIGIVLRAGLFLSGKLANLPLPYSGLFLIPIILLGCHQLYKHSPETFPIYFSAAITGWVFSIYATADWTLTPRYIAPYLPYCLVILLAGLTNNQLLRTTEFRAPVRIFYAFCFLILLFSNFSNGMIWFSSSAMKNYPGYVINCSNLLQPAIEISSIVPKTAVIATRRIGLIGYTTRRAIFDYKFSLPHKDVISVIKKSGLQYFEEPDNGYLAEIWQNRKPDYLLEDTTTIKALIERQNASFDSFQLHGITYYHVKSFKIGETEDWMLYATDNFQTTSEESSLRPQKTEKHLY